MAACNRKMDGGAGLISTLPAHLTASSNVVVLSAYRASPALQIVNLHPESFARRPAFITTNRASAGGHWRDGSERVL